ncbi:MAG: sulfotransferase [Xanthomonadales bacterium]|nr:sulfotransferase [Xanthomonadales bacterium]
MTETTLDLPRRLLKQGNVAGAIEALERIEAAARDDHLMLQQVAGLYLHCGQHERAGRCYARSAELQPSNPDYVYNLATSKTAFGDLDEAERLFTRAIQLNPQDAGAWLNRSILRRQTAESNHVEQLEAMRVQLAADDPGRIQVCFALAKELEDLRRFDEAFAHLQEGAHRRRLSMQYDIAEDESAMAAIARVFDRDMLARPAAGFDSARPIFILGLPRSGTTLVDRIISSHSQVESQGEHTSLALAVMNLATQAEDRATPAAGGKAALIESSARIDFAALGRRYCEAIEGFGNSAPRLVDKTPQNFLYLGLIHLALPNARIIHMRRNPMDSCYAIYKTLFRAGYPFSYSLQEVGRYFIAYHRLMEHWRRTIPQSFLDVDYERVIADPESETRRLLDYLELDWEDSCLEFHRHSGPAATASAAQVRQPIYSSSVGLWRRYERQLSPLAAKLREQGIDVDRY